MHFLSLRRYFLYLNITWTLTLLRKYRNLYCFITSISHGVENYFPRLWGMGISDAIFNMCDVPVHLGFKFFVSFWALLISDFH